MIALLRDIFGTYTPITYVTENGETIIPSGISGVNIEYIVGVAIFLIAFYSLFRIIGALITK